MARRKKLEIVDKITPTKQYVKQLAQKKIGKKKAPKHVLPITDFLYITCDSKQWILYEVTEQKLDKPIYYARSLDYMLKILANLKIQVPGDVKQLSKQIQEVYDLIDARIPADIKPKDLFQLKEVDIEDE